LQGQLPQCVHIEKLAGEMTVLFNWLERADAVILVDACRSGALAGSIRRFDVVAAPLPSDAFAISTHGVGINETLELLRVLGNLPPICIVYAIEATCFDAGAALSEPVAAAVPVVATAVQSEFECLQANMERFDA
ncbi:MAG: hydrogenase maturation protease, partial [Burkholderiales bacterium]|nr:hydrogenase maturation protease [Burkholderiales bacterium]